MAKNSVGAIPCGLPCGKHKNPLVWYLKKSCFI